MTAVNCFTDCDAELSVRPSWVCGQRPADRRAGRKPGLLPQSVDTPPYSEFEFCLLPLEIQCWWTHKGVLPQAIENFAVTVKNTAQLLQKFGTDLAETELPNDIQCTKDLLVTHTVKHNNLKVIYPCLHHIQ